MTCNRSVFNISVALIAVFVYASSCTEDVRKNLESKPTAFGKINEIVVVADDYLWNSRVGDSLRYYYSSAFPILPQPEPIFDLRHITPDRLEKEPSFRHLRTYVVLGDISDVNSPTVKMMYRDLGEEKMRRAKEDPTFTSVVGRDKWAYGQSIVFQFAPSEAKLVDALITNFPKIENLIRKADQEKMEASTFAGGDDASIQNKIKETIGVKIRIPKGYKTILSDSNLIWIRFEVPGKANNNILLRRLTYTSKSQFSKDYIKAVRDSIGRQHVSSTAPNSYMRVNDVDLPMLVYPKKWNDQYYSMEARGIWEMHNDFMGGAFLSYLVHNPKNNDLYFMDGFVYAPGEEKRNYIQYMDYVMQTLTF